MKITSFHNEGTGTLLRVLVTLATLLLPPSALPILGQSLNPPPPLDDALTRQPIADGTRNLVICVHGWNPPGPLTPAAKNKYSEEAEWAYLVAQLETTLKRNTPEPWPLLLYSWEHDANTGIWSWTDPLDFALSHATQAAINARLHGDSLGPRLPISLRRVHFIAHSAGAWCARQAAEWLIANRPYVVVQVTLLDPFIPPVAAASGGTLSEAAMSEMARWNGSDRIRRLENYYSDDSIPGAPGHWKPTKYTQSEFEWRGVDTNLQVEWSLFTWPYRLPTGNNVHYDWHSGPINFYGDTVWFALNSTQGTPVGLDGAPYAAGMVGWPSSLFEARFSMPQFDTQPEVPPSIAAGETVTLTVTTRRANSFQWYRNGEPISATSASHSFIASEATKGDYVVRATGNGGVLFSDVATVKLSAPDAAPSIASVVPRTLIGLPLPQTQTITITGTGFTSASRLTFNDGENPPFINKIPTSWTATQLTYNIAVGPDAAEWTVKVVNGVVGSLPYTFYVVSGGQLTGLSINGPGTVNENASEQFTAKAIFSDGTALAVTPNWSVSSGPVSISTSGLLSASSVNANTPVTVSAAYTALGITKTTSAGVTIVNSGSGPTYHQEQLIANGDFANGGSSWTLAGAFQADARFSNCRSCPGYAYLATADGSAGNNLSGTMGQTIQIPSNAVEVALDYFHRTTTTDAGGARDWLNVRLRYPNQSVTGLDLFWNTDANAQYSKRSIDLLGYRGQTVTLEFAAATDGAAPTAFRIDDVSVLVTVPDAPTPASLAISGPTTLPEGGTGQYYATMIYSDGSTQPATALAWGNNAPTVVTFSEGGLLSAGQVSQDTVVSLWTTATVNGRPYQAFKDVTVANNAATFSFLAINGPSSVNENSSGQFTATAVFSDGSSQPVTPDWTENSSIISISQDGMLTAGEVNTDTTVTIYASHMIDGVTRNASQDLLVVNALTPPVLTALSISGPSVLKENSAAKYVATASFSDGSSQEVNPEWIEDSPVTSITVVGLLSAGEVATDTPLNVSARLSVAGVIREASKSVTVLNIPASPVMLTGVRINNGLYQCVLTGPMGSTYEVQVSSDLVNWSRLGSYTIPTGGSVSVTDPGASGFSHRFYRAVATNIGPDVASVIASGLSLPTSLVLDGDNIYFADNTASDGVIKTVSKTGGTVTTLYTGAAILDSGAYRGVSNLQADEGNLYGHYGGYDHLNIFRGSESGGSLTTLVSPTGGKFVGVIGSDLYFGSGFGSLNKMPKTGGAASQVLSGYWVRNAAVDSEAVYFVDFSSKDVKKFTLSSGALTDLITGNPTEGGIFLDADNAYLNIDGSIRKVAKGGGPVSTLVSGANATGFASDGVRVFFVEDAAIQAVAVGGGTPITVLSIPDGGVTSLVVDEESVYWGDASAEVGSRKIWKMPKP